MKFRLVYEGAISGNRAKANEKMRIRAHFHPQLDQLWRVRDDLKELSTSSAYEAQQIGNTWFRPLVIKGLHLRCDLDFLFLNAKADWSILTSGDLDNRLKTLIDALRQPSQSTEVTASSIGTSQTEPMLTLLEDDALVDSISTQTDTLLGADAAQVRESFTKVIVSVVVRPTKALVDNISLAL